jgi:hypothetical protein
MLFSIFSYFLDYIYSPIIPSSGSIDIIQSQINTNIDGEFSAIDEQNIIQRRKIIGLFVLFAMIAIMVTSGINAFMNTR